MLNIFRAITYMFTSKGNFGFIARNMALIYHIVDNSDFGRRLTKSQKLYATALCDTYTYLQSGELSPKYLMEVVFSGTHFTEYQSGLFAKYENMPNADLINTTMHIEVLIFSIDTDVPYTNIIDSVIKSRQLIAKTINKTLENSNNDDLYETVYKNVSLWLTDKDFQNLIMKYNSNAISDLYVKFEQSIRHNH